MTISHSLTGYIKLKLRMKPGMIHWNSNKIKKYLVDLNFDKNWKFQFRTLLKLILPVYWIAKLQNEIESEFSSIWDTCLEIFERSYRVL